MVPPVVFKLKLPVRQKLALTAIFGLGVIVCAASISRLTTLYTSAYGSDPTAGSLISTIWTSIEAGLGIICANLPMLRTPLQHFFPKVFPPRSSSNQLSSTNCTRPSEGNDSPTLVLTATMDDNPMTCPEPALPGRAPAINIMPGPGSHCSCRDMNETSFLSCSIDRVTPRNPCDGCEAQRRPVYPVFQTYVHNNAQDASGYHCSRKVW